MMCESVRRVGSLLLLNKLLYRFFPNLFDAVSGRCAANA